MPVEPAVHDTLVVRVDRIEYTREYLERKAISEFQLDPEAARAEVSKGDLSEILSRDLNLLRHSSRPLKFCGGIRAETTKLRKQREEEAQGQ